jgi:hypothetical protein
LTPHLNARINLENTLNQLFLTGWLELRLDSIEEQPHELCRIVLHSSIGWLAKKIFE